MVGLKDVLVAVAVAVVVGGAPLRDPPLPLELFRCLTDALLRDFLDLISAEKFPKEENSRGGSAEHSGGGCRAAPEGGDREERGRAQGRQGRGGILCVVVVDKVVDKARPSVRTAAPRFVRPTTNKG